MITYGLKLWSNNKSLFSEVREAYERKKFGFVELYYNPEHPIDRAGLSPLREISVTIHAPHTGQFHEFVLRERELSVWQEVVALADFFGSRAIIVHPGLYHTFDSFKKNLALIDEPRILIENMAPIEVELGRPLFAVTLDDLKRIEKIKPLCFDFEKAVKAAHHLGKPYKDYIADALKDLRVSYFHISGGDLSSSIDEHQDLQSSSIDFAWIKRALLGISGHVQLVFETPKRNGIRNDLENMAYFKSL